MTKGSAPSDRSQDGRSSTHRDSGRRLRAFIVDQTTGAPLRAVPIAATALDAEGRSTSLGILASDHSGYVAFNLNAADRANAQTISIAPVAHPDLTTDVEFDRVVGGGPVLVALPGDTPATGHLLPSVQDPCSEDWRHSPASLATNPTGHLGDPGCEVLLPSNVATHEFHFQQLVRDDVPARLLGGAEAECVAEGVEFPPQGLPPAADGVAACIRTGEVLEYQMSWCPLGHSLGQLLYSLPLAPCESVNIAVVDWSRADDARREEDSTAREQLRHELRRDRTVHETVDATLKEWQRGGSIMGGLAGAGSVGPFSLGAAIGGGYSTSSGTRTISADTVQRLADAVVQAGTSVRSFQSTVVVQATQAERDVIETRTVTNHNHCHAMTVLYYEVLRHFRVVTSLVSRQDVILVKYAPTELSMSDALCHRWVLERALLDPRLASCFDALERVACEDVLEARAGPGSSTGGVTIARGRPRSRKGPLGALSNLVRTVAGDAAGNAVDSVIDAVVPARPSASSGGGSDDTVSVAPRGATDPEAEPVTSEDHCCARHLLDHLNCNQYHYNRALWMMEDPDQRASRFDRTAYGSGTLLDAIENRPIAVLGQYVAFPIQTRGTVDSTEETIQERLVSLPTRGVFAEAELSHCNACEERDVTRFWDWTESPCPEKAPEIAGVTPGSRAQQPQDLGATPLGAPVLNVVNSPGAPDPTGMAGAMALLGTPDVFRDMSGRQETASLLNRLADGTISMAEAREEARRLQDSASPGAKASRPSAEEQHDQLQVYRSAENHGDISDRGSLAGEYLQNAAWIDPDEGEPPPRAHHPQLPWNSGSTAEEALRAVDAFLVIPNPQAAWNLRFEQVARRLETLVRMPDALYQGELNLCGPAAFLRTFLQRDPLGFVNYCTDLYLHGEARIGTLPVAPSAALRERSYDPSWALAEADFMALAALRDEANVFYDYLGRTAGSGDMIQGGTWPSDMVNWLYGSGLFAWVADDTNLFSPKGVEHALALPQPSDEIEVFLEVNCHMLTHTSTPKSDEWITGRLPNHWLPLRSSISETGSNIEFRCWTWAREETASIPGDVFAANYYGAVHASTRRATAGLRA